MSSEGSSIYVVPNWRLKSIIQARILIEIISICDRSSTDISAISLWNQTVFLELSQNSRVRPSRREQSL